MTSTFTDDYKRVQRSKVPLQADKGAFNKISIEVITETIESCSGCLGGWGGRGATGAIWISAWRGI